MSNTNNNLENYKVYKQRYFILASLTLVNISNAATWITISIVATTAGNYYDKTVEAINIFALLFYVFSIPFSIIAPYIVNKFGLWHAMHIGAGLNCIGSVIKAIGTSSLIDDKNTQYVISITGQAIAAMAQGFILFTPTKLSQVWFPQSERVMATSVTSLANAFGIVVAAGFTPMIVQNSNSIPLNNNIWAMLAVVTEIFTLIFVTRSKPKTPPSKSAEQADQRHPSFKSQLKAILSCRPYLILMNSLGIGVALFSVLSTLTQQMLCPLGYSETFSGLVLVVLIFSGFAGSIFFGIFCGKKEYFGEFVVVAFSIGCLAGIALLEFYLVPDLHAPILLAAAVLGVFSIGSFPSGLELAVEFTYPVEQTMSTAFTYLVAQIEGCLLIIIIPILATDPKREHFTKNACSGTSMTDAKDYSIPVTILIGLNSIAVCVMLIFMEITYNRRRIEGQLSIKSTLKLDHEEINGKNHIT